MVLSGTGEYLNQRPKYGESVTDKTEILKLGSAEMNVEGIGKRREKREASWPLVHEWLRLVTSLPKRKKKQFLWEWSLVSWSLGMRGWAIYGMSGEIGQLALGSICV